MAVSPEYRAFVMELLEPLGGVEIRRMFGGAGLFRHGLMFGLISDERLYLKVDEMTRADFEARGAGPFTYGRRDGERTITSYCELPEEFYDEPEEARRWAEKAIEAALRIDAARPKSRRRRKN